MTIREVLAQVKRLKPSTYEDALLLRWLSECEGYVTADVASWHDVDAPVLPYTEDRLDETLLAKLPYDELYVQYLCAKIDQANGDYDRYQNDMSAFNDTMQGFGAWFNRTHSVIRKDITI